MAIPVAKVPFDGTLEGEDRDGPLTLTSRGAFRWEDNDHKEHRLVRPLVVATPDVTEDEHGSLSPAVSASVRQGEGKHGPTWQLPSAITPPPAAKYAPEESRNHFGEKAVTKVGSPRTVDGPIGKAWTFEEGSTNYVYNPTLDELVEGYSPGWDTELNGTLRVKGWGYPYNGGVRDPHIGYHTHVDPTGGPDGSPCWVMKDYNSQFGMPQRWMGVTHGMPMSFNESLMTSGVATVSLDAKVTDAAKPVVVGLYVFHKETGNRVWMGSYRSQYVSKANTWERLTWTFETTDYVDFERSISMYIYGDRGGIDGTIWVDNIQVETKPYPTSFIHGDMGAGYEWADVPIESESIRPPVRVQSMPNDISPRQGSVAFWYRRRGDTALGYMVDIGGLSGSSSNPYYAVGFRSGTGDIFFRNHRTAWAIQGPKPPVDEWFLCYFAWDGLDNWVDFGLGDGLQHTTVTQNSGRWYSNVLYIGSYGADYQPNADVGPVLMFNRPLTESERARLADLSEWDWDTLSAPDGTIEIGYRATENHIANPSAENNTHYWSAVGAGVTITRDESVSLFGDSSVKVVADGEGTGIQGAFARTGVMTTGAGTIHVGSMWVKGEAGFPVRLLIRENASGVYTSENFTLTGDWQRIWVRHTQNLDVGDLSYLQLRVDNGSSSTWTPYTLYVDGVQIEQGSYPSPYVDGTMDDAEWTGGQHESSTVRQRRGNVFDAKSMVVRYIEDGETKHEVLSTYGGPIGHNGYLSNHFGTMTLAPFDGKTLEVESLVAYDQDVSAVRSLIESRKKWNYRSCSIRMSVPKKSFTVEEGTTNLMVAPHPYIGRPWSQWGAAGQLVPFYEFNATVGEWSHRYVFPEGTETKNRSVNFSGYAIGIGQGQNYAGQPLTLSAVVRGTNLPEGTEFSIKYLVADANASQIIQSSGPTFVPTGEKQRIHATIDELPENTDRVIMYVTCSFSNDLTEDTVFEMFHAQVETLRYPTSPCPQFGEDGSLLPHYEWTGTTYYSGSRRNASNATIQIPPMPVGRGSFYLRYRPNMIPEKSQNPHIFYQNGTRDILYRRSHDGLYTLRLGAAENVNLTIPHELRGEPKLIGVEWENGTMRLWVHGAGMSEGPCPEDYVMEGPWYFGAANVYSADGTFDEFMLFDRPLTDSEREMLAERDEWEWDTLFPRLGGVLRIRPQEPLGLIRAAKPIVNKVNTSSNGSEE